MNTDERHIVVNSFLDRFTHHPHSALFTERLQQDRGLFSMGWDLVGFCFHEDALYVHFMPRRDHVCIVAHYPDGASEMISLPGYDHRPEVYQPMVDEFKMNARDYPEYEEVMEGVRAFFKDYLNRIHAN